VADLHEAGAYLVLAVAALLTLAALAAAALDRGHDLLQRLVAVAWAVFVVQGLAGAALLLTGDGPEQALHVLYGVGLAVIIPLTGSFTAEAPPRMRSWALAVTGVVALLLTWRLFGTG
jgi:hypothetical protein